MANAPLTSDERFPFTEKTMPERGRPFEVIYKNQDGSESVYEGDHVIWDRFIALYGYPVDAPRWRYTT